MTNPLVPASGTPREVLADLGELTRKVRTAQRGTWFPVLLFGVLTLGGILIDPLTVNVRTIAGACPAVRGSAGAAVTGCTVTSHGSSAYWTLGVALVYVATALFYVRRSRKRGVGTLVRPYVLAGVALLALVATTSYWATRHGAPAPGAPLDFWGLHLDPASGPTRVLERLTGPAADVGLPLLVLAWVERNRALLVFALVFLAIELTPVGSTGWAGIAPTSPWSGLPHLALTAAFLLLGALGFALTQPPRGRDAS